MIAPAYENCGKDSNGRHLGGKGGGTQAVALPREHDYHDFSPCHPEPQTAIGGDSKKKDGSGM